jgi:hypothetical protein
MIVSHGAYLKSSFSLLVRPSGPSAVDQTGALGTRGDADQGSERIVAEPLLSAAFS